MKTFFAIINIWVLCGLIVLQQNTCAAVRSSPKFHSKGIFAQTLDHLSSQNNEAARDGTILTDETEVKQSTRDNYKVYSPGSHSIKYMEMERRKLIYRVDYDEATTYPTTPSDASRPPKWLKLSEENL